MSLTAAAAGVLVISDARCQPFPGFQILGLGIEGFVRLTEKWGQGLSIVKRLK